jgi:hypothetical protein
MASSLSDTSWEKYIENYPVVDPHKIFLPKFQIKLGLMKNSVKAMNQNRGFHYLQQKFPWISDAKIKEGILVSSQIKQLMNDRNSEVLEATENTVREAFIFAADNFLGNHKMPNYSKLVEQMLEVCRMMGCNMMLKYTSFILTWISFQQTLQTSVTSPAKGVTRTFHGETLPGEMESDYAG